MGKGEGVREKAPTFTLAPLLFVFLVDDLC